MTNAVDFVLTNLDASGVLNWFVDLSGTNNGIPSVAELTAMRHLTNNSGWTVYWNGPPSTAPKISNVAGSPGSNTATVTWTTDNPSDSKVYYGATTCYDYSATDSTATTNHSVSLSGLTANTVYHFYVSSTSSGG